MRPTKTDWTLSTCSGVSPSDSLKLVLALHVKGISTPMPPRPLPEGNFHVKGRDVCDCGLTQNGLVVAVDGHQLSGNAAILYFVGFPSDPSGIALASDGLEWEATHSKAGTFSSESLKALDSKLGRPVPEAVRLSLFASLVAVERQVQSYPNVAAFYKTCSQDKALSAGLAAFRAWSAGGKGGKPLIDLPAPKVEPSVTIVLDHHDRIKLPVPNQRNVLITSALPYVNNVPHLGNIIGSVLSADVFSRYCRLRGYNSIYMCGTDEYGTATETKALEEKLSCQALCDKYHAVHKQVYDWFDIDFDFFGRTTTPQQTTIAQDIFKKAEKNGYVTEDTVTQLYCEKHQAFLADRFVEGICPLCGYEDARGDQCDKCGKLLNAVDLKSPRCKLDGAAPITKQSRHLFLDLPKLQTWCEEWVQSTADKWFWTVNGKSITESWLKEGLKPRCITRDLKWGTPVPKKGFEGKVFYVWFDAPIGYFSITANYTPDWEKWWKNPDQVELFQFMGKDNVPFHTVIFPCSLKSTGDPYTYLNHINTTEYLNYESGKFSKSRGVGVFGNNAGDSGIPVEVWRYYLLANRPESSDFAFTWEGFASANNGELLANLGNFVNRIVKFVAAKYNRVIPAYTISDEEEQKLLVDIDALLAQYVEAMEGVRLRRGLKLVMDISARGNLYLQDNRLDNSLFDSQRKRCDNVVAVALNLVYLLSALVQPFMPSTSESILRQLNLPTRRITDKWSPKDIQAGHTIGLAEYLFKRIEDKTISALQKKYAGKQDSAAPSAKKDTKKGKSAKPAAAPAIPDNVQKTPAMLSLEEQIQKQGDLVRKAKTDKADAAVVKTEVDKLLALKAELQALVKDAAVKA